MVEIVRCWTWSFLRDDQVNNWGKIKTPFCSSFLWSCLAKYQRSDVMHDFMHGRKKKNSLNTGTRRRGRKMDKVKSSFIFSVSVRSCMLGDQKLWSPLCLQGLQSFVLCWALGNSRTYTSTCGQFDLLAGVQDFLSITLKSTPNMTG